MGLLAGRQSVVFIVTMRVGVGSMGAVIIFRHRMRFVVINAGMRGSVGRCVRPCFGMASRIGMDVTDMTVIGMCQAKAFLAVEYQEIHAEGIEGGDEHTDQHGDVRNLRTRQMRCAHGFDDAVLRIEAREKWRAYQSE